jgi:SAM-dependent methyltransferase
VSQFTAHNIRLDNGELTWPECAYEITDHPVLKAVIRVLRVLYRDGFKGKRIADLGCLEGGYSVEFARLGLDAVGIEVRASNFGNCLYVKEQVDLPNLSFVNDDVRNVAKYGFFDVIFCCGILYHLDRPVEFLRQLSAVCSDAVIINTHYANTVGQYAQPSERFVENEGVVGMWYHEYDPTEGKDLNDLKWASWNNPKSFWPKKEYIPQMLRDAGFDLVFEQLDWFGGNLAHEMIHGNYAQMSRAQFVGIKTSRTGGV